MPQDYNETINLPKTDFPMRAGLPQREPGMLKDWESEQVYQKLMEKTPVSPGMCCMTVRRSPTAISTWVLR